MRNLHLLTMHSSVSDALDELAELTRKRLAKLCTLRDACRRVERQSSDYETLAAAAEASDELGAAIREMEEALAREVAAIELAQRSEAAVHRAHRALQAVQ